MLILQETTNWGKHTVRNNVYILNDSQTKMLAYVPAGSRTVQKFRHPQNFDRRGRTFVELGAAVPDPTVMVVQGSKGQTYYVTDTDHGKACSCPGWTFRGNCRHVTEAMSQ